MNPSRGRIGAAVLAGAAAGFVAGLLGAQLAVRWLAPTPGAGSALPTTGPIVKAEPSGGSPAPATAPDADTNTGLAIAAAVKKVNPAVVNIDTFGRPPQLFGGPWDDVLGRRGETGPQLRGSGSGFIINAEKGLVLTNQHVIEGAERIEVTLGDGRAFQAERVGADKMSDIALLKISPDQLPEAPLGLNKTLEQGEWVIAIGNPFRDFPHTVTVGVVSALNRQMPVGDRQYSNLIQTDAAINMGNSGGPLCDLRGEVIGVNSAIFSPTQTYAGIGFAIVIDDAARIAQHLIDGRGVPWLGVGMRDVGPDQVTELGLPSAEGVLVTDVYKGSPADKAGILPKDVIVSFNGQPVKETQEVPPLVLATRVDQVVEAVIIRGGRERKVKIKIGARENP